MEKNILKTIAYFDIFNYPLTAWEGYHWLYNQKLDINYQSFITKLSALVKSGKLATHNGFYFLPKKKKNINIRQHRYMLAELKYKIALRAIKILRCLPFIKYIGICNTLAYNNAQEDSDIDLFIITSSQKIWRARFLAALLMQILDWRPNKQTAKNKICLSFFVSEDNLDLESIAIEDDIYLQYWVVQVVPIYDPYQLHTKFLKANNHWVRKFVPNYLPFKTNQVRVVVDGGLSLAVKKFLEFIFWPAFLEKLLKRVQFGLLPNNLKSIANKDTRVIMKDNILKFHDIDKREEYREKFKRSIPRPVCGTAEDGQMSNVKT